MPRLRLTIALLVLPALGGCFLMPHPSPPVAVPDTTVVPGPDPAAAPDTVRVPMPERRATPKPTARAPRAVAPPEVAPPAPASPPDPTPQITVQISAEERRALLSQIDEDSRLARERMDQLDPARMTPELTDRLDAVRDLLANAAEARARDDIRSAALRARKARILAEDLPRK